MVSGANATSINFHQFYFRTLPGDWSMAGKDKSSPDHHPLELMHVPCTVYTKSTFKKTIKYNPVTWHYGEVVSPTGSGTP